MKKAMNQRMNNGLKLWYGLHAKAWCWKEKQKQEIKSNLQNNRGVGIVEIALLIVVIVALAFMFKKQISDLLNNIFKSVDIKDLGNQAP